MVLKYNSDSNDFGVSFYVYKEMKKTVQVRISFNWMQFLCFSHVQGDEENCPSWHMHVNLWYHIITLSMKPTNAW